MAFPKNNSLRRIRLSAENPFDSSIYVLAYNPKASEYVRKKYKKKLESFEVQCDLIKYLSRNMTRKFKEPEDRLIDFDNKLSNFMSLKEAAATGVSQ